MGEDADKFRHRARLCRELAKDARQSADRKTLTAMADELEAEAEIIDAEDAKRASQANPAQVQMPER